MMRRGRCVAHLVAVVLDPLVTRILRRQVDVGRDDTHFVPPSCKFATNDLGLNHGPAKPQHGKWIRNDFGDLQRAIHDTNLGILIVRKQVAKRDHLLIVEVAHYGNLST